MARIENEYVAGEGKVEQDERKRDTKRRSGRAHVLCLAQEHDRDDTVHADHAQHQRGQVTQKVGQEQVHLAREQTQLTNVGLEVELHDGAHHRHIQHGQVDAVQEGKVAERAELAHLLAREHYYRQNVRNCSQNNESDRHHRPDVVDRDVVGVLEPRRSLISVARVRIRQSGTHRRGLILRFGRESLLSNIVEFLFGLSRDMNGL